MPIDKELAMTEAFPQELLDTLRRAQRITVLTGAGISAESGLPTFRDKLTGLWAQYRPEDLSTPEAFRRDPRLVWEWFAAHRTAMAAAAPNPAHYALVRMEAAVPQFTLLTQNIDGLHQRAGNRTVVELHGNIACTKCFVEDLPVDTWDETGDVPPCCPRRGCSRLTGVPALERPKEDGSGNLAGGRRSSLLRSRLPIGPVSPSRRPDRAPGAPRRRAGGPVRPRRGPSPGRCRTPAGPRGCGC